MSDDTEYDRAHCPLCDLKFTPKNGSANASNWTFEINCLRCGYFVMTGEAWQDYLGRERKNLTNRRYLISALVKTTSSRRDPMIVDSDLCNRIASGQERERTVPEKFELLVRWFARQSEHLGFVVPLANSIATPGAIGPPNGNEFFYPAAFCRNADEWTYLRESATTRGLFQYATGQGWRVTTKGWEWLDEHPKAAGDRAFIAMWFDDSMKLVGNAIAQAIDDARYTPKRVDQHEYNGGVMDEVLALIRQSQFVVADFTGNRGGVYYEAAFATGLGIRVIHTCREDHLAQDSATPLHFDVRHLNMLPWTEGNLPEFQERLQRRIEATIGRGPR